MTSSTGPSHPSEHSGRFGRWMIIGAWVLFLILLTQLFSQWLDTQSNPNRSLKLVTTASGEAALLLKPNRSGHYLAPGEINGVAVTFLLDTGATRVAVSGGLAEKTGLEPGMRARSMTAGGLSESWLTQIERLRLGPFEMEGVQAVIMPDMPGNEVLLGMSFLRYLKLEQSPDGLKITLPD